MDKETAKEIIELVVSIDKPANRILELLSKLENKDEAAAYRKILGNMASDLYTEVMMPIFKQHPDLNLDKYYGPDFSSTPPEALPSRG